MKQLLRSLFVKYNPNFSHRKLSYSQYGEDIIIFSIFREHLNIQQPSYLDIGAHHPFHFSNTALFYKFGCKGVNIEASPDLIKAFNKYRPNDKNVNIGISPIINEKLTFYIMASSVMNTFIKEDADALVLNGFPIKQILEIPCYNLEYIIENYCDGVFPDFMSLDVEGLDEQVLENYHFKKSRPKVICVENRNQDENGRFYKIQNIRDVLNANNYVLIADTFLNDIFVDKSLIAYEPSITDSAGPSQATRISHSHTVVNGL